jgi:ATP adenylyltransferase
MRYIEQSKEGDCIFCQKPREEGHHQHILRRGERTFTILNLYPYTVGHLMVVPYRHVPRLSGLTEEERRELGAELRRAEGILRRVAGARAFHAGMNLGRAAGAGVDGHLHVHLVPRDAPPEWRGAPDGERLPVAVEEIFRRLRPHFEGS